MMSDYVSKTSDICCDMRLVVEGAIVLYEEDGAPLYSLALKAEKPQAAAAFDIIGRALFSLRQSVMTLDEACRQEILRKA